MKEPKEKKCANKECARMFKPFKTTQRVCSPICAAKWAKDKREAKEARLWKVEQKTWREDNKTKKDHEKDLEKIFNTFIRLRDWNQPCISCRAPAHTYKKSAGHYFPAGSYKNLRFNEDNVHGQCWNNCNRNRHGNLAAYLPHLINKIGQERYEELLRIHQEPAHFSIPDILEMKKYYKQKVKELKIALSL
jgi:Bacteriophage Lambda NinG protein